MSLLSSKIVYLFIDTTSLESQRTFMEDVLGLEVIENAFRPPHHRHGVVKYDAGSVILALNVADGGFDPAGSDGVVTVCSASPMREAEVYANLQTDGLVAPTVPGDVFVDRDNHAFAITVRDPGEVWPLEEAPVRVDTLKFTVTDLQASIAFYGDRLGLSLLDKTPTTATFMTANVRLLLVASSPTDPERSAPSRKGFLTVFHTPDIRAAYRVLERRGVDFRGDVRFSQIGGTVRFHDPAGRMFCLYEPSEECLAWESGPKLTEIIESPGTSSYQTVQ